MAFVRGSQIKFIILPDILSKAPYFNRIKMWRKFKGHAVFGANTVAAPHRGQSAAIMNRTQARSNQNQGQSHYQQGGPGNQHSSQQPPQSGGYPGMVPRGLPMGYGRPPAGGQMPPRPGVGQAPPGQHMGYPPQHGQAGGPGGGGQYGRY